MSPYEPRAAACLMCKAPFIKSNSNSKYCSPKCCAQNMHNHRRKNIPNYRTVSEIEAEWFPEKKRLEDLGILVTGLNDRLRSKENARRAELRDKKSRRTR